LHSTLARTGRPDDATYPDSPERFSIGAPLARGLRLNRLGIHHERLPPGRRTSYPHAESDEEEFIYVLEGYPEVWINGYLWKLEPGDSVGFPAGTGICHTFLNNTEQEVRLLVVGEANKKFNRIYYPLNPAMPPRVRIAGLTIRRSFSALTTANRGKVARQQRQRARRYALWFIFVL
jgi:uncharacterized cupin superfamily protein